MEYFKIHSLWKREGWYFDQEKKKSPDYQKGRQSFIIGDYAEPEFGNIKRWVVDEKIDGTNVRVCFNNSLQFKGRTDNAQMPCHLLSHLQEIFTFEKMAEIFPLDKEGNPQNIMLFGEGYGPKIQAAGGNYREDVGFILFDIWANGWWLERGSVSDIASQLGIKTVPILGIMTEEEIVEFVKSKPLSQCSRIPQVMEGVVCRPDPLLLFRNGKPIVWKLKCKEFA
jgi:ATP-dependent RNA circularization protein (DNA/RNA ligase family)